MQGGWVAPRLGDHQAGEKCFDEIWTKLAYNKWYYSFNNFTANDNEGACYRFAKTIQKQCQPGRRPKLIVQHSFNHYICPKGQDRDKLCYDKIVDNGIVLEATETTINRYKDCGGNNACKPIIKTTTTTTPKPTSNKDNEFYCKKYYSHKGYEYCNRIQTQECLKNKNCPDIWGWVGKGGFGVGYREVWWDIGGGYWGIWGGLAHILAHTE